MQGCQSCRTCTDFVNAAVQFTNFISDIGNSRRVIVDLIPSLIQLADVDGVRICRTGCYIMNRHTVAAFIQRNIGFIDIAVFIAVILDCAFHSTMELRFCSSIRGLITAFFILIPIPVCIGKARNMAISFTSYRVFLINRNRIAARILNCQAARIRNIPCFIIRRT